MSDKIIAKLNELSAKGATFAGITYRADKTGELARFTVQLNGNYPNLVRKSLEALQAEFPAVSAIIGSRTDAKGLKGLDTVELQAAGELLASFNKSLEAIENGTENADYTKAGLYESIFKGVKRHKLDGSLEVAGTVISKTVLEAGVYPVVKSSAKTLAKAAIRKALPIGKYRTFRLEAENLSALRFAGNETEAA